MAILSKGTTFSTGDQVTSTNLNALVDSATFATGAVDDSTTALDSSTPKKIIVKNGGISATQLATNAVETVKITDANVTLPKIATQADQTVLANVSGGTASPTAVPIVDNAGILINNDALGTSDTQGATQGNIKAYVDNLIGTANRSTASGLVTEGEQGSVTLGAGLIIKFGTVDVNSSTVAFTFKDSSGSASPFPNGIYGVNATVNESIGSASETCSVTLPTVNGCLITGYQGTSGAAVGRVFFVAYGF